MIDLDHDDMSDIGAPKSDMITMSFVVPLMHSQEPAPAGLEEMPPPDCVQNRRVNHLSAGSEHTNIDPPCPSTGATTRETRVVITPPNNSRGWTVVQYRFGEFRSSHP
jgi:hypothetical protein